MAFRRGLSRGHLTRSPRRKTSWSEGVGGTATQSQITASSSVIASAVLLIIEDGVTLIRTRGRLQLFLDNAAAGGEGFLGAFGIAVATSAAVAAGAASVPTPITEQGWDGWLYWRAIQLMSASAITGGAATDRDVLNESLVVQNIEIDSKAMRKLKEEDTIYACLQVIEIGTATLNWNLDSRVLFKLP